MKKFKRITSVLFACCLMAVSVAGCGKSGGSAGKETTAGSAAATTGETKAGETKGTKEGAKKLKIALLIPGNLGDKSFFDGSKAAMDTIKEKLGAQTDVVEMGTDTTKYLATYEDYCEDGYDLIMTVSTAGDDVLKQVSTQYPDQKFINLDTDSVGFGDNVLAVVTKSNEMSALAGAVAALKAKEAGSNTIGFIGGMDIPGINYFLVGYIEGAQSVNPDVKVKASYVGDFTDSATAKELALIMYNSGVPIIYQAAGGAGLGVFEAATSLDKLAIGVDSDQAASLEASNPDQAKHIITSAMKKVSVYAVDLVNQYADGTLTFGGKSLALGLKDGGVGLAENKYYDALMSDEQKNSVKELEQKIISGEVKLSDVQSMSTDDIAAIRSKAAPN